MNGLKGKIAMVNGASKGIGAPVADHLAAERAVVVVNYASSKNGADAVVTRISQEGGKAIAIRAEFQSRKTSSGSFPRSRKS